jgi:hypothetical protein
MTRHTGSHVINRFEEPWNLQEPHLFLKLQYEKWTAPGFYPQYADAEREEPLCGCQPPAATHNLLVRIRKMVSLPCIMQMPKTDISP